MKLRFTLRAIENLPEINDYILARSPAGARRVQADIVESLQTVTLFPKVGRRQSVAGVRKFVTRKYSYLIYYALDDEADEIIVLSLKHSAREREHSDI